MCTLALKVKLKPWNWKHENKVPKCSFVSLNFKVGFWQGVHDTIHISTLGSRYRYHRNKYCDILLYRFSFSTALIHYSLSRFLILAIPSFSNNKNLVLRLKVTWFFFSVLFIFCFSLKHFLYSSSLTKVLNAFHPL